MTRPAHDAGATRKPLVIGLTGGIGSGKSTVAALFAELGVPVLEADRLTRELVLPGTPALSTIVERFGPACLHPDGSLDRAWLRQRIFTDPAARQWLESLLHPAVRSHMQVWTGACKAPYCILVIPLLLESGQRDLVDRVLVVDIPEQEQVKRVAARDGLSHNAVRDIMACQSGRETRLAAADEIIDNALDTATLKQRVADLHSQFMDYTHEHRLDTDRTAS